MEIKNRLCSIMKINYYAHSFPYRRFIIARNQCVCMWLYRACTNECWSRFSASVDLAPRENSRREGDGGRDSTDSELFSNTSSVRLLIVLIHVLTEITNVNRKQ